MIWTKSSNAAYYDGGTTMEQFIKSPNLPENRASLVVLDGRARKTIINSLKDMGIEVLLTTKCTDLYDAVSYHPDIFIHHLWGNHIIAAPNAPADFLRNLEKHGFNIIMGQKSISGKYPDDIAYNVARIGDYAVCNIVHTDKKLLQCLTDRGIRIIDVKQGYSKCSLCIVDNKAVITSDEGLYSTLLKYDFDILKINPGSICLSGLDYGFIGGASGLISNDTVAFAGNIMLHPDYKIIKEFLLRHGKNEKVLDSKELMDIGTIIPLKEYSVEEIC